MDKDEYIEDMKSEIEFLKEELEGEGRVAQLSAKIRRMKMLTGKLQRSLTEDGGN